MEEGKVVERMIKEEIATIMLLYLKKEEKVKEEIIITENLATIRTKELTLARKYLFLVLFFCSFLLFCFFV